MQCFQYDFLTCLSEQVLKCLIIFKSSLYRKKTLTETESFPGNSGSLVLARDNQQGLELIGKCSLMDMIFLYVFTLFIVSITICKILAIWPILSIISTIKIQGALTNEKCVGAYFLSLPSEYWIIFYFCTLIQGMRVNGCATHLLWGFDQAHGLYGTWFLHL